LAYLRSVEASSVNAREFVLWRLTSTIIILILEVVHVNKVKIEDNLFDIREIPFTYVTN